MCVCGCVCLCMCVEKKERIRAERGWSMSLVQSLWAKRERERAVSIRKQC